MNEAKELAAWLETVKFKKRWLGGISEQEVWSKIRELHGLYQKALLAERVRYDTLLQEYRDVTPEKTPVEGTNGSTERSGIDGN